MHSKTAYSFPMTVRESTVQSTEDRSCKLGAEVRRRDRQMVFPDLEDWHDRP